jgi:hypothetical protein
MFRHGCVNGVAVCRCICCDAPLPSCVARQVSTLHCFLVFFAEGWRLRSCHVAAGAWDGTDAGARDECTVF